MRRENNLARIVLRVCLKVHRCVISIMKINGRMNGMDVRAAEDVVAAGKEEERGLPGRV
jgi:hypothetical protein